MNQFVNQCDRRFRPQWAVNATIQRTLERHSTTAPCRRATAHTTKRTHVVATTVHGSAVPVKVGVAIGAPCLPF
jgi:hypothetical protein